MMKKKYLLGIDVGTSATKVSLFDYSLNEIASASNGYPMYQERADYIEQDPIDWYNATVYGIKSVIQKANIKGNEIVSIGLSGQMHGLVMLDVDNNNLRKSIIWCDQRSTKECVEMTEKVGAENLLKITANPPITGFTASKILWVKNNEPEIYKKCRHILLPKDYVRFRLTGDYASEYSDSSGTQLMDIGKRCWSQEILDKLDIDLSLLPKLYESHEVTGHISAEAAKITGLSINCIIVGGAGDQAAAAIGCGAVENGIISDTIGTSGAVFACVDSLVTEPNGRVNTFCHAVPNMWHVMGVTQGAGLSLQWFADKFYKNRNYDDFINEMAIDYPIGTDLIYLPYLIGERSPHLNPKAKGVFFGLTNLTTREEMLSAVLDGIVFSQMECLDVIKSMGINVSEIRMCGGGAKNSIWLKKFADVFGTDVLTVNSCDGGTLGAAILAGVGIGLFDSVIDGCHKVIKKNKPVDCDAEKIKLYSYRYGKYKKLYRAIEMLY